MNSFAAIIPSEPSIYLPRFVTKSGERSIALSRIVYLIAQRNYTVFYLNDGETVVTTLSLNHYYLLLEQHEFLRIHKSCLLNLYYLPDCKIEHYKRVILPDGKVTAIARRRLIALKKVV